MGFFDLFKNEVSKKKETNKNIDTGINLHPTSFNPIIEYNLGSRNEHLEKNLLNIIELIYRNTGLRNIFCGYMKVHSMNSMYAGLSHLDPYQVGYMTKEAFIDTLKIKSIYKCWLCFPIDEGDYLCERDSIEDFDFYNTVMNLLKIKMDMGGAISLERYGKCRLIKFLMEEPY